MRARRGKTLLLCALSWTMRETIIVVIIIITNDNREIKLFH